MKYEKTTGKEDVLKLIEQFSCEFSTLSERVDLDEYARKLSENAEVIKMSNDEGNCVGMAAIYANDKENRTAYISLIGILEKCQKMGYGSLLLQHCILEAKKSGMNRIRLEVDDANDKARRFYANHGFVLENISQRKSRFLVRKI